MTVLPVPAQQWSAELTTFVRESLQLATPDAFWQGRREDWEGPGQNTKLSGAP